MISFSRVLRHVYVASDGAGRHKIGMTNNLKLRAYHLSRDARRAVTILHSEPQSADAEAVEQTALWLLADHQDESEWFSVTAEQAVEAVRVAKIKVANGELPAARLTVLRRPTLGPRIEAAMEAAYRPRETRKDFIREAVERELERRESGR